MKGVTVYKDGVFTCDEDTMELECGTDMCDEDALTLFYFKIGLCTPQEAFAEFKKESSRVLAMETRALIKSIRDERVTTSNLKITVGGDGAISELDGMR